jgi:hypothetical protein
MQCERCGFVAHPAHRFCACCGQAAASVQVSPVEGIIMHDRPPSPPIQAAPDGRSGTFELERRGRAVDVVVEISLNRASVADFQLVQEPVPLPSTLGRTPTGWEVRLSAKNRPVRLRLQCTRPFPLQDVELTVRSLLPTEPASLIVVDGGNPRWALSDQPIGVYPARAAPSDGAAWVCALPLLDGVERVTQVDLLDAEGRVYEYAELRGPPLPRLIQAGRAIEVALTEPPRDPGAPLTLQVRGQAGTVNQRFQILHQSPVVLEAKTVHHPPHAPGIGVMGVELPLIVGLDTPTQVGLRLLNAGSANVRLRGCSGPSFLRVISVVKREVEADGGPTRLVARRPTTGAARLPRDVDGLTLPHSDAVSEGEWLDQILIELAPACAAEIRQHQLRFRLMLDLESAGGERSDHELLVSLHVATATVLNEDDGYLAVDFGTVNTCARLVFNTADPSQDIEFPGYAPRSDPKQLKSCYNVHMWHQGRLLAEATFGEQAWDDRHLPSVDFVPKLRLGHAKGVLGGGPNPYRERRIVDQRQQHRDVDGVAAAHQIMELVLDRTVRQTGRVPRTLSLSHPVAFSAAAREDLLAACKALGVQAEVEVPEPVAFLRGVLSNRDCCNDILAAADNWKHHHDPTADTSLDTLLRRRPMLGLVLDMGGGTTDITVFHVNASDNVDVVANFGYNWFGGEALTLWIAQLLSEKVRLSQPSLGAVIPQSERDPKQMWRALMGHQLSEEQRRYLAEVRRYAEECKLGVIDLKVPSHTVPVVAADGTPSLVTVDVPGSDIADHVKHFINTGLDDIFERLGTMRAHNAIQTIVPGVVIIAGNAGRLRWLPEALDAAIKNQPLYDDSDREWLNNPNGLLKYGPGRSVNPDFLSDAGGPWDRLAKIGVVHGMVEHDGEMIVDTQLADPRWWYLGVPASDTYTLALPSGTRPVPPELLAAPQRRLPEWLRIHRAPGRSTETRLNTRRVFSTLGWGRPELNHNEHRDVHLQYEGTLTPPAELLRRRGEVAYGKDPQGGFGAFMRTTDDGASWTWVPCVKRGGSTDGQ